MQSCSPPVGQTGIAPSKQYYNAQHYLSSLHCFYSLSNETYLQFVLIRKQIIRFGKGASQTTESRLQLSYKLLQSQGKPYWASLCVTTFDRKNSAAYGCNCSLLSIPWSKLFKKQHVNMVDERIITRLSWTSTSTKSILGLAINN